MTALVLSLLINVPDGRPQAGASFEARDTDVTADRGGHLGIQSTVRDILRHPSFAGFSRLLLPWDDRACDEQMRLTRIGSLLPYHSHVDPETVATALNRMIDEAALGRTVFYSFYTDAERQQEPARGHTGLFFFRGRPGAPFAVISPGGGFSFVVVGEQDAIAPPAVMERRVEALRRAGTEVQFREYEGLGHGFGLGTGTSADGWVFDAIRFWETSLRRDSSKPSQ